MVPRVWTSNNQVNNDPSLVKGDHRKRDTLSFRDYSLQILMLSRRFEDFLLTCILRSLKNSLRTRNKPLKFSPNSLKLILLILKNINGAIKKKLRLGIKADYRHFAFSAVFFKYVRFYKNTWYKYKYNTIRIIKKKNKLEVEWFEIKSNWCSPL